MHSWRAPRQNERGCGAQLPGAMPMAVEERDTCACEHLKNRSDLLHITERDTPPVDAALAGATTQRQCPCATKCQVLLVPAAATARGRSRLPGGGQRGKTRGAFLRTPLQNRRAQPTVWNVQQLRAATAKPPATCLQDGDLGGGPLGVAAVVGARHVVVPCTGHSANVSGPLAPARATPARSAATHTAAGARARTGGRQGRARPRASGPRLGGGAHRPTRPCCG